MRTASLARLVSNRPSVTAAGTAAVTAAVGLLALLALAACPRRDGVHPRPPAAGGAAPEGASADPATQVATLDGKVVTQGDLDAYLRGDLLRARNEYLAQLQQLRENGLEALLVHRLLEGKAAATNVTVEAFLEREVIAKLPAPTDEEVRALYDQATAQGEQLPPFDQIRGEIREYMIDQRKGEAIEAYGKELLAAAKIERSLPPLEIPPVTIAGGGPAKGAPTAPITIVEFSDYECPYCRRAEETVARILDEYGARVRVVFRHFPLPSHPNAAKAAEAAACAEEQGKFWELHARLFEHQRELAVPKLKELAREVGVDAARFDACLDSGARAATVEASRKEGEAVGVAGTPTFFVNGRIVLSGADYDGLKAAVERELAR